MRGIYLWEFSQVSPLFSLPLGPDIAEYHQRALEICSGSFLPATPDIHAPLYSFFLAGLYWIGELSIPFVRIVQSVLNVAAWGGFYLYWRSRNGVPRWSCEIILAIAMIYPSLWFFSAELVSESLLLPLLLFAVSAFDFGGQGHNSRHNWWLLGGALATGLAVITHPMALFFAFGEIVYLFFRRPLWRSFAVCGVVFAVILPVFISRSIEAKRLVLIQSNSMFNLFLGNNADSTGGCYLRPGREWMEFHLATTKESEKRKISADKIYVERMADFVVESPLLALGNFAKKAILVWSPDELSSGADTPKTLNASWGLRHLRIWISGIVMILALYGLVVVARRRQDYGWLIQLLILGGAIYLAQVLTVTSGRYRVAMLPTIFALASVGILAIQRERIWSLLLGVSVVLGALWWSPVEGDYEGDSLLAEGWYALGDFAKAEAILMKTDISFNPDNSANMLGNICLKSGRLEAAEKLFNFAAKEIPYSATGFMNLGIVQSIKGDYVQAEKCFKQAISQDNSNSDALYNYGYFLEQQRRIMEAEQMYLAALKANGANRKAVNSLGVLKFNQGDFSAAVEFFRRACRLEPSNDNLRRNLAIAQQKARH